MRNHHVSDRDGNEHGQRRGHFDRYPQGEKRDGEKSLAESESRPDQGGDEHHNQNVEKNRIHRSSNGCACFASKLDRSGASHDLTRPRSAPRAASLPEALL